MTWGMRTYASNGREMISPDGFGGVFYGLVTIQNRDPNFNQRWTFYDIAGRRVFPFVTSGGYHNLRWGNDGGGNPYIEANGYAVPSEDSGNPTKYDTVVGVFYI